MIERIVLQVPKKSSTSEKAKLKALLDNKS